MRLFKNNKVIVKDKIICLGIESSCDDTAVAIVDSDKNILCNYIRSDAKKVNEYGGVVPEIVSRDHLNCIFELIKESIISAKLNFLDIDIVSATSGPGLIGGVLISSIIGRFAASILKIPFFGINHLEGHVFSARLSSDVEFPFLCVLLTGGHTQILLINGVGSYIELGGTKDDSVGESFDKVARMLGMEYPGGPMIEKCATKSLGDKFLFPRPMINKNNCCDFSFSGLKTSVFYKIQELKKKNNNKLTDQVISDICSSFQYSVSDVIIAKIRNALRYCPHVSSIAVVGGVAANRFIRKKIESGFSNYNLVFPNSAFCTDNAAMIAWAAVERCRREAFDSIDFTTKSNWPLNELL